MIEKLKAAAPYAKSHRASSYAVGVGLGLYAAALLLGAPRDVAGAIAAAVICIGVPVLNEFTWAGGVSARE